MDGMIYSIGDILGKGSYGSVHSGINLTNKRQVALKFIEKSALKKPTHFERLRREVRILRLLKDQSPYIVSLEAVHETPTQIILVTEALKGGELITLIKQGLLKEENIARESFSQLVTALATLHGHGIIHRDIKPQNILLAEPNSASTKLTLKLIDFGFATIWDESRTQKTFCGSPYYASPEMVSGIPYSGPEVDIWSLGVILYSMISGGQLPFTDSTLKGLYNKIASGCSDPLPSKDVSRDLLDILSRMLCLNPSHRATIDELIFHPWIMGMIPAGHLINIPCSSSSHVSLSIPLLTYLALLIPMKDEEKNFGICQRPLSVQIASLSHLIEIRPDSRISKLYRLLWHRMRTGHLNIPYIRPLDVTQSNINSHPNSNVKRGSSLVKFIAQRLRIVNGSHSSSLGINGTQSFQKIPIGPTTTNTQVTPISSDTVTLILLPEEIDPLYQFPSHPLKTYSSISYQHQQFQFATSIASSQTSQVVL